MTNFVIMQVTKCRYTLESIELLWAGNVARIREEAYAYHFGEKPTENVHLEYQEKYRIYH